MQTTSAKATQDFVPIREIRDGYVVLKDGSIRALLMVSTVNFALKSEDERNAIIFQFQNMLNSLDFSIQIFIQSRKLDIRPYITLLESRYKEQTNELLKIQTREYVSFIKNFTETTNIMTKGFYIVVPYAAPVLRPQTGFVGKLTGNKDKSVATQKKEQFEESRTQLEQRLSVVDQGLERCGLRVAQLGTEECVELFYKLFNPGETEKAMKMGE